MSACERDKMSAFFASCFLTILCGWGVWLVAEERWERARTSDKPLARRLLMSSRRVSDHGIGIEKVVPAKRLTSIVTVPTVPDRCIVAALERAWPSEGITCQKARKGGSLLLQRATNG